MSTANDSLGYFCSKASRDSWMIPTITPRTFENISRVFYLDWSVPIDAIFAAFAWTGWTLIGVGLGQESCVPYSLVHSFWRVATAVRIKYKLIQSLRVPGRSFIIYCLHSSSICQVSSLFSSGFFIIDSTMTFQFIFLFKYPELISHIYLFIKHN